MRREERPLHPRRRPPTVHRLLLLLPLTGLLLAPGNRLLASEDPVGTWSLEVELPGRTIPSELLVWRLEDGSLEGSWKGPRGSSGLQDVHLEGAELRFSRTLERQGQQIALTFSGVLDGDRLTGTFSTPQGELAVTGSRSSTEAARGPEGSASDGPDGADGADGEEELIEPSDLPTAEAGELLGNWALQMSFQGTPIQMNLELSDLDGKLAALLVSPQGEQAITDITTTEEGLRFAFDSNFGPLVLLAKAEGGGLVGTFGDVAGSFSTEVSGSRAAAGSVGSRRRSRSARPTALAAFGEKEVRIYFADPGADGSEFAQLQAIQPGQVISFPEHGAIKLMTDLDLRFADVEVPYGNVHPEYPGVYSLWLQRTPQGWSLLLNRDADVWGTMHDPEADVAEIPLDHRQDQEIAEKLTVELVSGDGEGELRLAWGPHRWAAVFSTP